MQRYSAVSVALNALTGHKNWQKAWRSPPLRDEYDVIIIGAGGHGLAAAHYLAKEYGITNVAVLERGWLGGGNIARNTVTIRSNYLRDESIPFYVKSVKMYEGLSKELNYNLMYSRRSMIDVLQEKGKYIENRRRMMMMNLHGAKYEEISIAEMRRRVPLLTGGGPESRMPILGCMVHPEAAVCRHDAVAWGYARSADARGVEMHQNTAVTKLLRGADGAITGVETTRGVVRAKKVAVVASGHTRSITDTIGLQLPLSSFNLAAFVSEPIQPVLDTIVDIPALGVYLNQSDKGEIVIGGAPDPGRSFRRDIKQSAFEDAVAGTLEMFPAFKRLKMLRQWGGTLEISADATPILSTCDVPGLIISAGWWGGFKAVPAGGLSLAHLIATGTPNDITRKWGLERFRRLDYVLETATTVPH